MDTKAVGVFIVPFESQLTTGLRGRETVIIETKIEKREDEIRMSDIIKTQQGLARKAQFNREYRFDDLYHIICKREWIEEALLSVLSNSGAKTPGVDGMNGDDFNRTDKKKFENEEFRRSFVLNIQTKLKSRTFKPFPVRRVEIPKPGTNKKRPLGIPTIKDRVVQTLLKMLLEPIWEADFYYFSNGFRPGRCTMDCIQPLYTLCNNHNGYKWIVEGDIKACFDKISHELLIAEVSRRVADAKILKLIEHFLKSGIVTQRKFAPSGEGTPQGGIISPLLANIYLHQLDEWCAKKYMAPISNSKEGYEKWRKERTRGQDKYAVQMFRFADDFILLVRGTKEQAEELKQECRKFLEEELKLELSESKTKLTHIRDGFDFLSFHVMRNDRPSDRRVKGVFITPTAKGQQQIRDKIKDMTDRKYLTDNYFHKVQAINAVVRGWATYYRAVNASDAFNKLDNYVWLRLRTWLSKRHQASPMQVRQRYTRHVDGPMGGYHEFVAKGEDGKWIYRYKAVQTKLIRYRPRFKKKWPNPYLEKVKQEHYFLPTVKGMWAGTMQQNKARVSV